MGKHLRLATLAPLFLALVADPVAHAQQLAASSRYLGAGLVFHFSWQTPTFPTPQNLQFSLPITDAQRGDAEFTLFNNDEANTYAFHQVQKAVVNHSSAVPLPQGITLALKPALNGYEVSAKGPQGNASDEALAPTMKALESLRDKAMDDYLWQHYYMDIGDNRIMPDHKRIAARYAPALAPMAAAVQAQTARMDDRTQINWLLGFFQTIPYDQLLDRYTSNGAGFKTPYGLLMGNKGDCDTKSVALAAVLRRLHPGLPLTMVYTPGHAFIGVGLPQGKEDYALRLGNQIFVLADATGPGFLTLGQVAPEALVALNSGQYSYQEIP